MYFIRNLTVVTANFALSTLLLKVVLKNVSRMCLKKSLTIKLKSLFTGVTLKLEICTSIYIDLFLLHC